MIDLEILKERIKTKSWYPNNFDDIFYVKDDRLYVKTYNFDKWKDLLDNGYENDKLVWYFKNLIYDEIAQLREYSIGFLYDETPSTIYDITISSKEGIEIPFTIR